MHHKTFATPQHPNFFCGELGTSMLSVAVSKGQWQLVMLGGVAFGQRCGAVRMSQSFQPMANHCSQFSMPTNHNQPST